MNHLPRLRPAERAAHNRVLVLSELRRRARRAKSAKVRVAITRLARSLALGERTTYRIITELCNTGAITRAGRCDRKPIFCVKDFEDYMSKITDRGWEKEFRSHLKMVPNITVKNGNSTLPDVDAYGTYQGLSWRAEAKFTEASSLPFSAITKNEFKVLDGNHHAGGLSFVAIARDISRYDRRVWVARWGDLLSAGMGVSRGSIGLERPAPYLFEIPFDSTAKTWRFIDFIRAAWRQHIIEQSILATAEASL